MEGCWQGVADRMGKADERYGPFRSTHEGLGVLLEEVHELVAAIQLNSAEAVRAEALDVAAVAMRLARCVDEPATRERSGM